MPMDDRNTPPIDRNNNDEELVFEGNDSVAEDQSSYAENIPSENKNPEGEAVSSSKLSGKDFGAALFVTLGFAAIILMNMFGPEVFRL